jgi:hypothetical protein
VALACTSAPGTARADAGLSFAAAPSGVASIRDEEPALTIRPTSGDADLALSPRASIQVRGMLPFGDAPHAFELGDLARTSAFTLRRVRVGVDATILPSTRTCRRTSSTR